MRNLLCLIFFFCVFVTGYAVNRSATLEYVCSTETQDIVRYQTDAVEVDVLIIGAQTTSFYNPVTTQANTWYIVGFNHYDNLHVGAVHLYIGSEPQATIYVEDIKPCEELPDINPYGYYGVECGGDNLVYPELAGQFFYVDGNEYTVNADGVISWVVPLDMIWRWELYDTHGQLIVVLEQTEINNCGVAYDESFD